MSGRRRRRRGGSTIRPEHFPAREAVACTNCKHSVWAVGVGQGFRCTFPESGVTIIPSLKFSCAMFSRRAAQGEPGQTA